MIMLLVMISGGFMEEGRGAAAFPIDWMHPKQVKILHENALFCLKFFTNFLGSGYSLLPRPHPLPF